ncbi:uncharacterized protein LOC143956360 isoform X1 [Lithobates pipiens]
MQCDLSCLSEGRCTALSSLCGPLHKKGFLRMTCESKRRAMPMSLREMIFMVKILDAKDYDCKHAKYPKANLRKDHILQLAVATLQRKCGVTRTKMQLRKRWSDLKNKKSSQLESIRRLIERKWIRRNCRKVQIKQEPDASVESNKSQQNEGFADTETFISSEQERANQLSREVTQSLSTKNIALERIAICMDEIRRLKASIRTLEKDMSKVLKLISKDF